MKDYIFLYIFLISFFLLVRAEKCPCQDPLTVCIGTECLKINDGSASCSLPSDCADQVNGFCDGEYCSCNAPRKWSVDKEECLVPNDDSSKANSLIDCMDQTNGMFDHIAKTCKCSKGSWSSKLLKCGVVTLGDACDGENTFCFDMTFGDCLTGKCRCKKGYRYKSTAEGVDTCKAENDNTSPCTSLYQCFSISSMSQCKDNKCTCMTGFVYSPYYGRCGKPNNGLFPCNDSNECLSNAINHGVCSTVCLCSDSYMWDDAAGQCLAPNNGLFSCRNSIDCYGFLTGNAKCDNGKCSCIGGTSKMLTDKTCLKYNDNKNPCNDISECYDQGPNAGCLSGKCSCRENSLMHDVDKICLLRNDGWTPGTASDCYDKSASALFDGKCNCKTGFTWSEIKRVCAIPNNKRIAAGSLDFCADNRPMNAELSSGKCACKTGYSWYNANGYYLCRGDIGAKCLSLELDCKSVSPISSYCDTTCKCNTGYWNVRDRCLAYNTGVPSCDNIYDCIDSNELHAECSSSNRCTCKANNRWDSNVNKCLGVNNGLSTCESIADCYDSSKNAECSNNYCTCMEGLKWNGIDNKCECNFGRFLSDLGTCDLCSPNFYKDEISDNTCKVCPPLSTSSAGAKLCTCNDGYYYNSTFKSNECQRNF